MKKFLLFVFVVIGLGNVANAQCNVCTPDTCSGQKPAGGLCNQLPDDTAGLPYDAVISFYMPSTLTDTTTLNQCGGCSSVTLRHITIVGIQGLPPGMTYLPSNNGYYDVENGVHTGCVAFCGTPVAPGTYYLTVNLLADVTANGIPIVGSVSRNGEQQSYRDTIVIFPGEGECPGTFSIGSGPCITKACDSLSVDLNATLTNTDCPSLISYSWNLGGGNTSSLKSPGVIKYNTPDTFPITLTTTYYSYKIKSVTVTASDGWCNDVEECFCAPFGCDPEPYIVIPSLAFKNRGGPTGKTLTFNNLDTLVIPSGNCDDQISIQVWEEDTGLPQGTNPAGSQDDSLNTHFILPAKGSVASALNRSSVTVVFDTVATSSVNDTVDIIVFPQVPEPVLSASADSLCFGDSALLSITPVIDGYQYYWFLNDTTELLTNDTAIYTRTSGSYKIKMVNLATGCEMWGQPVGVAFAPQLPGSADIIYTGTEVFLNPFPSPGYEARWYYNGNLVTGQTGQVLPYLGDGTYTAEIFDILFPTCNITATPAIVSGIGEVADMVSDLTVAPNPNNGRFNVKFTAVGGEKLSLTVANVMGQKVFEKHLQGSKGSYTEDVDLNWVEKGIYIVTVETTAGKLNRRIVVQ